MKDARIRIEEATRGRVLKRWQFAALLLASSGLLAAGLTVWLLHGRGVPPDQMLNSVPLTAYTGTQEGPSFSPDGDQVAFSWDGEKQDNFDIYVKRIGAGPPLRLTNDPAADTNPAWSPDGRSIAFLRASGPGRYTVVLIPPLGGPERVVKEVARKNVLGQALAWSPDSKWLAIAGSLASQAGLWLLSAETGEYRNVNREGAGIDDISPAFAPDGRTLAFARAVAANSCDLYLLSVDEDLRPHGEPRRLTRENQVIDGLAWTADGRELVYSSGQPGNESLWRMAISGGARPRQLTEQHEVYDLAISGRSHRLVFVQSRREMDIYRAELRGQGGETRGSTPLIASSRLDRFPRYSPDGKKIAFASLRSGNWQVWMSDSDGGNAAQMTSFDRGEVRFTSWSADGRQIGFSSNAEGPYQAYAIDLAGGKPSKLEALGTDVFAWCWSHDGRWIFFTSIRGGTRQLWKMPAGGGAPQQLTRQGATQPFESKDGRLIYYVRPEGVWSVPVDGGEEREVFKFDADELIEADRRGIFFATKSAFQKAGDLMFYRLPNGPITKVAGVQTHYGLSVSPDGRSLLYTKFTATGSDLMLVENFR
jgi:Tol biopolymer transport system component